MPIDFNHTIVPARDSKASAKFVTDVLGLSAPRHWGPFQMVTTANGANLDYKDSQADIPRQHYAFLVGEDEFDAIFKRIRDRKLTIGRIPVNKGRVRSTTTTADVDSISRN
ncbi:VOC family protein [Bradyrhizobium ivorense]|uniref:VOC family protein n=1 Tax=Bradyrhizobium ivorense TaxID=2511166 RepID=UPI001E38CE11|nr:VOC family protein [Bradyrhizobium ivorense]